MARSKSMIVNWIGVFSLLMILTIAYIDRVNVSVLITNDTFLNFFNIAHDRVAQGALMTAFLIAYGVAAFIITPFYERFIGVKSGLLISVVIWGVTTIIAPVSSVFFLLLIIRVVLGLSEGPLFSLNTMFVSQVFPNSDRGKANAVWALGVSVGLAVGFPLISYLVYHFSWQSSYITLGILNLLIGLPLIVLFINPDKHRLTKDHQPGHKQQKLRDIVKAALKTPGLLWLVIWEIVNTSYLWGTSSWLPSYLLSARGFSIEKMGILASLPFVVSLLSKLLSGYLIDHLERKSIMWMIGGLGCMVSISIAITTTSPILSAVSIIVANGFWGIQGPVLPTTVQLLSRAESVGSAYGIINGTGNLVSAFVPVVMGAMISISFSFGFALLIGAQFIAVICGIRMAFLIKKFKSENIHAKDAESVQF
ncbi:putative MFS family arabinose efflux permease [Scopulibacillus daqui]|uniref:MFS family arabinose efflux permease n=1 Tax=Scopulibacillus daqui TaxID=1469162 RepID=A0ABS2PZL1_9BACL|nr:MFS transporter [Scopulibacillus daqui]MBM7644884.1 putative MFS family arabinose efflux permease [Scopulibacillus daqui]